MSVKVSSITRTYGTPGNAGRGAPVTRRAAAEDGVAIRVLDWKGDDGTPLQVHHGAMGNATMWQLMADAFPERRVVASDHRGYGATDGPVGTCTTEWHVRDMDSVRRVLSLGAPVLIGYSGGAVDSVHYAATHPDAVSAVVLIDPPMFAPPPKEFMDFFAKAPREFSSLDEYADFQRAGPLMRGVNRPAARLYGTYVLAPDPDGRWRPLSKPNALAEWNESLAKLDVWGLAAKVQAPCLVVRAGGALVLPPEVAEKLASTLQDGRLAVVEKASHALPIEDPRALNAAIRDFLADVKV